MYLEKRTIKIKDKEYEVFNCRGNGQCQCKSCKDKGKYYVSWTDWFWKLTEDGEAICFDCLKEKLEVNKNDAMGKSRSK